MIGQSPSCCFQRAASTALWVSAVTPKVRSSLLWACSTNARQATSVSFSIRTASFAASVGRVDRHRQLVAGGGHRSRDRAAGQHRDGLVATLPDAASARTTPGCSPRARSAPTRCRSRRRRRARWPAQRTARLSAGCIAGDGSAEVMRRPLRTPARRCTTRCRTRLSSPAARLDSPTTVVGQLTGAVGRRFQGLRPRRPAAAGEPAARGRWSDRGRWAGGRCRGEALDLGRPAPARAGRVRRRPA